LLVWEGERGMVAVEGPALRLPHPELERRDFVLAPLAALVPGLRPRGAATVTELLAALEPEERTIVAQLSEVLC
jgi:2-amino-4-hydroxy-6-hydroxymethyldihydropteridine diphosphokinase